MGVDFSQDVQLEGGGSEHPDIALATSLIANISIF